MIVDWLPHLDPRHRLGAKCDRRLQKAGQSMIHPDGIVPSLPQEGHNETKQMLQMMLMTQQKRLKTSATERKYRRYVKEGNATPLSGGLTFFFRALKPGLRIQNAEGLCSTLAFLRAPNQRSKMLSLETRPLAPRFCGAWYNRFAH